MQLANVDFSSIITSLLKDDLELGVKIYLLTNPKLALLFMNRLNNTISTKLAALNDALTSIKNLLLYVHREELPASIELTTNIKNELYQLQNIASFQNKVVALVSSFKELKDSKGSMGVSNIDAKQDIYTAVKLAEELNQQLYQLITNLNQAETQWKSAGLLNSINQKIIAKVKTVAANVIDNIDNNSKADSAILLTSCLELLRTFKPSDPYISPIIVNATLMSLDDKAVSRSVGTNTTSTLFSVIIGSTLYSYNYPAANVSSVYLLSKQTVYTIPANSSLYLKITAVGIPVPAASGTIVEGVANYPITAGVLTIDSLITLINTTNIQDTTGTPRLYLVAAKTENNELVLSGVSGVTKIEVVGTVLGTLAMGVYTEPRYPVHNELGFVAGQTTGLDLLHLATFLSGKGLNVTKDTNLVLTANSNITINPGIALDIGMPSVLATATEYECSIPLDIGDIINDMYVVEQLTPLKLSSGPKLNETSFKLKSLAISECKRIALINYSIKLDRIIELIDILLQQKISSEDSIKTEVSTLINQVQGYLLSFKMLWSVGPEDTATLLLLTKTLEENNANLYITQLNNCRFNELTDITKAQDILTKIEAVGKELVQ